MMRLDLQFLPFVTGQDGLEVQLLYFGVVVVARAGRGVQFGEASGFSLAPVVGVGEVAAVFVAFGVAG